MICKQIRNAGNTNRCAVGHQLVAPSHPTASSGNPGARSRQRRPQKRANDERYPDGYRYQPVHEMRQIFPEGQLLSIVDVKSN
jgi:hypothetical protein